MEMHSSWEGDRRMLAACSGDISFDDRESLAARILGEADRRLGPGAPFELILDLENVGFVNSAGLGALFQLRKAVEERAGRLAIANVPPALVRLFRTVGLDRYVPCVDSIAQARRSLETEPPAPPAGDGH